GFARDTRTVERPILVFGFLQERYPLRHLARMLYRAHAEFRDIIDRASEILRGYGCPDIAQVLLGDASDPVQALDLEWAGPARFALHYAWAQVWHSWGISPDEVYGELQGADAAACVAGCFEFDEGLKGIVQLTRGEITRLSDVVSMRAPNR